MAKIVYHTGQERDIVREKEAFADSIFNEQYKRAITLMSGFVDSVDDNSLKIITFCGDRGEGKTSCMSTVIDILKYPDNKNESGIRSEDIEELSADCQHLRRLSNIHITDTRMIDPSFFDDHHNVLEIVIGQLYSEYLTTKVKYQYRAELETAFQNVKQSLRRIERSQGQSSNYSDLYDLNDLAVTIELKSRISDLIKVYLQYVSKEILVIPIDDIDLSLDHTYEMCEQIRKYLCVPKCVVMMCAKIQLLRELIAKEFSTKFPIESPYFIRIKDKDKENPIMDEAQDMAKKYLDKLIPASSRVNMPKAYDFGELEIEIKRNGHSILPPTRLKDCILELIFTRTRYLFYNPVGGISPIMPNNLRELFNLIGLLASMEPVGDASTGPLLKNNKSLFKGYFFSVWKDRFDSETQESLDNLINYDYGTSFNREIIKVLTGHFTDRLNKDYQIRYEEDDNYNDEDGDYDRTIRTNRSRNSGRYLSTDDYFESNPDLILKSIVNSRNFGYNVTAGDLFYLFSRLEKETLSESGYALIFFLKSLYSIKLYEAYEKVTENNSYYPDSASNNNGLTVVDHRFDNTNALQQLTGGSYFTYAPGDLLPKERDLRVVESGPFIKLITELKEQYQNIRELSKREKKGDEDITTIEDFDIRLNIAELFILMSKCAIRNKHNAKWSPKEILNSIARMRKNVEAYHFRSFHRETGYYVLDIMAPFANIVNPKFSYKRFWAIDDDFYDFIWKHEGSLLNQMILKCKEERKHLKGAEEELKYHQLLSIAVIRNSEVLSAIKENIELTRFSRNDGRLDSIRNFYDSIKKSEMATHKRYSEDNKGEPYHIIYEFLTPISNILNDILNKENNKNYQELLADILFPNLTIRSLPQTSIIIPALDDVYKDIKAKKSYNAIAREIHKLESFKNLKVKDIKFFINNTLIGNINSNTIRDWLKTYYSVLSKALINPKVLTEFHFPQTIVPSAEETESPRRAEVPHDPANDSNDASENDSFKEEYFSNIEANVESNNEANPNISPGLTVNPIEPLWDSTSNEEEIPDNRESESIDYEQQ